MKEIGQQYSKDDMTDNSGFLRRARLHQSKFRANNLDLPFDTYGNYLTRVDGEKGKNFYDGFGVFDAVNRYRKYNKPLYSNMLRSEHIPFNFFIPLDKDKDFCRNIFNEFFNNSIQSIDKILIEYAPSPADKYLNDRTSFDAYIEYTNCKGERGIIGIEVKYTEQAYALKKGSKEESDVQHESSLYYKVSEHSKLYKTNSYDALKSDTFRQVWRNHILGESILLVDSDKFKNFTSLTIFPRGNSHFIKTSKAYIDLLTDNDNKFLPLTYEDFFAAISKHCPDNNYRNWLDYLTTRYIVTDEEKIKNNNNMNIRHQLNFKDGYYKINREERNLAAIFYHTLLIKDNLKKFLNNIGCEFTIVDSEMGIYFEYAYLRDLWSTITPTNDMKNEIKRKLILDFLNPNNRKELEKESKTILEFNTYFGAVPKPSGTDIQSPGNWSIGYYNNNIKDNDEFLKVCKFKWCFNAKPDIVIHTSHETAICIEAKFISAEGQYPNSEKEKNIFKARQIRPVGQLAIQKKIMELLGISTQFIFLVQHKSSSFNNNDILELTWEEAFSNLDTTNCPFFIKEWLKRPDINGNNNEINLQADFLTFKNQIIQKFGEQYFDQTEIFFERAIAQAEQGLLNSAIADGSFALELINYSNDKTGIYYLIGFLSQLYCDLGQISKAKAYYELGIKLLDIEDKDYEGDKQLFAGLKELIDGESWKGNIEDKTDK